MRKSISVLLVASLVLASCGWRDSRVNPRNWFGNSRSASVAVVTDSTNPLLPSTRRRGIFDRPDPTDTSVPLTTITDMRVEPTNTGAILYAQGVAARQGAYNARLTPENDQLIPDQDGVLRFSFRVVYPSDPTPVGTEFSRTAHEAFSLTTDQLAEIRVLRVEAAQNARESRRR